MESETKRQIEKVRQTFEDQLLFFKDKAKAQSLSFSDYQNQIFTLNSELQLASKKVSPT